MVSFTSKDVAAIPIYCINLASSAHRRQRMQDRFAHHKLIDQVVFIDAVTKQDPILDFYHDGYPVDKTDNLLMCSSACFISHLKAVRTFYEHPNKPYRGIICEDDILLDNEFSYRLRDVMNNMLEETPLLSLSYMMNSWDGTVPSGKDPNMKNVFKFNGELIWGAQMYMISRPYAKFVLDVYENVRYVDQPHELHSSEIIIRASSGYLCRPPLAIEDGIDSDRAPGDLPYHHNHFSFWGYQNYSDSEKITLCPFADRK